MDTSRNVIRNARASLLLPSRPKTPHVSCYSRKVVLVPLKPLTSICEILVKLESNQEHDILWSTLAKISQEEDISEKNLNIILQYLLQGEITKDKWKILKNLSYKIENHTILGKYGIFQVLNHELSQNFQDFLIITEIYRNLASNPRNSEYFQPFFQIIQDISYNFSEEKWFNILRICAKLSFLDVYDDFWISKFLDLLSEFTTSRVYLFI
jgi:hypothetical protein